MKLTPEVVTALENLQLALRKDGLTCKKVLIEPEKIEAIAQLSNGPVVLVLPKDSFPDPKPEEKILKDDGERILLSKADPRDVSDAYEKAFRDH